MIKKHQSIKAVLFFFMFSSLFTSAQEFTTSLSTPFEGMPTGTVFKTDDGYIASREEVKGILQEYNFKLSKRKFGVTLLKYDASMKLVKKNELLNGDRKFGPFPSTIAKLNGKPYIVYSIYEGDEEIKIMAEEIDQATLNTSSPKQLIRFEQKNTSLEEGYELLKRKPMIIKASPDNTKLLVLYASSLNNQYFISVFDKDLNHLWNKKEMATEEKIVVSSAAIDNNENVYVAYKYKVGKDDYNGRVAICQVNNMPKELEIKTENGTPYQILLIPSRKENQIYTVGTFANASGNLIGVFSQTISSVDFKLGINQSTAFSPVLVEQLDKDSWASTKVKNYGLLPLDMKAFELEDGTVSMVGEFMRHEVSPRGTGARITGSILNIRFNNDGPVVNWIPKYRVSVQNDIGASYYPFVFKAKLFLFYNDEAINLKREVGERYSGSGTYKNVSLIVAWMEPDGKIKREKLLDLADKNFLPVGDAITPLSSSSLLVPVVKIKALGGIDKESKWATINIE